MKAEEMLYSGIHRKGTASLQFLPCSVAVCCPSLTGLHAPPLPQHRQELSKAEYTLPVTTLSGLTAWLLSRQEQELRRKVRNRPHPSRAPRVMVWQALCLVPCSRSGEEHAPYLGCSITWTPDLRPHPLTANV